MTEELIKTKAPSKKIEFLMDFKQLGILFLWSTFLWVLYQNLVTNYRSGLWLTIFLLFFIWVFNLVLYILKINKSKWISLFNWLFFIGGLFFCFRENVYLLYFNFIAIIFYLVIIVLLVIKWENKINFVDFATFTWLTYLWAPLVWIGDFFIDLWANFEAKKDYKYYWNIVKWILISIPVLFLLIGLLSSADAVFWKMIWDISSFIFQEEFIVLLLRIGYILWLFTGVFYFYWINKDKKDDDKYEIIESKHIEINILLSLISVVFLTFIIIQIWYLFWDRKMIIDAWFTYAEYARKWFLELLSISFFIYFLLNGIDFYLFKNKHISNNKTYKILNSWIIILTLFILLSAVYRLNFYCKSYGLTEIRFFSYILMWNIALSLIFYWYKNFKFINYWKFLLINILFFAWSLNIVNLFNTEKFITNFNSEKEYTGSVEFDRNYVFDRTTDSIDIMIKDYKNAWEKDREEIAKNLCNIKQESITKHWQEFTLSRYLASKKLEKLNLECLYKINEKN